MDALLQYTLYTLAFSLLFLELFLMLFCALAIIVIKFISKWIKKKRESSQTQLGKIIESYLFSQEPIQRIEIPSSLVSFRNLVETLEHFDQTFNDLRWVEIRDSILSTYVLPQAERFSTSYSWFKRQLAARALLLQPKLASDQRLEKLLDDSKYLVRVAAAVCITKKSNKELFKKVVLKMSQETSLSQFPYRDALIETDEEKFEILEELLHENKNKAISAICLDVLSTRYSKNLLHLVKPFVNDADLPCRTLAVRALGNIPSLEAIDLLMDHLYDSDWNIRAESINSLQKLYALQAIPKIIPLLSDPVWWVRLQAALTLKAFGKKGIEALSQLNEKEEPLAYEIAEYTLALP